MHTNMLLMKQVNVIAISKFVMIKRWTYRVGDQINLPNTVHIFFSLHIFYDLKEHDTCTI